MKKLMIGMIGLFAAVLSVAAISQEPKFKISMTILSGETVLATPVMVTNNGKAATLVLGNKQTAPETSNSLRIELLPTQQAEGTVQVAVGVKNTEDSIVDQQPVKNVRAYDLALKLHPGKTATVNLPNSADKPAMTFNIKVELVGEN